MHVLKRSKMDNFLGDLICVSESKDHTSLDGTTMFVQLPDSFIFKSVGSEWDQIFTLK